MECKIVCDGKECATVECGDGEFKVKLTEEGKKMKENCCKCC